MLLMDKYLILIEIKRLSNSQLTVKFRKFSELYIIDSKVSKSIFKKISRLNQVYVS